MPAAPAQKMDLIDFNFDAYLANDRTLNDPEIVAIDPGARIRLRVINGSAATVFWIDTGLPEARLISVDGHDIQPLTGPRFGIAMGRRLDIELDLTGAGAFPILALREGTRDQTSLILATKGASIPRIATTAASEATAFLTSLRQESALRALTPLAARPATQTHSQLLAGAMQPLS